MLRQAENPTLRFNMDHPRFGYDHRYQTHSKLPTMTTNKSDRLAHARIVDAAGLQNFTALLLSDPDLHAAILRFPFDAERDDYCGNCADYLRDHLADCGFMDFHHHAHGHSFLTNDLFVVDVWPDMQPKVWLKSDPILANSAYETKGNHACWCTDPAFGPCEWIAGPPDALPDATHQSVGLATHFSCGS